MLRKKVRSSFVLDKLHKGFVCACVGVTIYGTYLLGWRFYRYFTVVKPDKEQKELLAKQSLLTEGSSDVLKDTAQQLRT